MIGPGSECQYKSLMEYATGRIPEMQKKIKDNETQLSQTSFAVKNQ